VLPFGAGGFELVAKLVGHAVDYLLGGPTVGGANEVRLRRWLALPAPQLTLPHTHARYVVVATETTGSGSRRERLRAIGAAGVERMQIDLADCFMAELRLRRTVAEADRPLRGSRGQSPVADAEPALDMLDFLEYLGQAPLVAFAIEPARRSVERAVKSALGVPFRHPWIDLAALLSTLYPEDPCATLPAWLERVGLAAGAVQDPLGNAFATAQLLQVALVAADRAGLISAAHLMAKRSA
jgi:DNA polymerase-3 subunit epsilon